ncbi:hypothetical protein K438DRAFT_1768986 [Mycena galopus ATCC 62051]|nr:hypothetical protein K438DRAFT_1768986 [Mycena galopus ATCC 62051]
MPQRGFTQEGFLGEMNSRSGTYIMRRIHNELSIGSKEESTGLSIPGTANPSPSDVGSEGTVEGHIFAASHWQPGGEIPSVSLVPVQLQRVRVRDEVACGITMHFCVIPAFCPPPLLFVYSSAFRLMNAGKIDILTKTFNVFITRPSGLLPLRSVRS